METKVMFEIIKELVYILILVAVCMAEVFDVAALLSIIFIRVVAIFGCYFVRDIMFY